MASKRARKSRSQSEPLTAPLAEIAEVSAPRKAEIEEAAEKVTGFVDAAFAWATDTLAAGKELLGKRPVQLGLAGFGAGLALVGVALKRRKA